MVIGKRLERIASYVKRGMCVADIGTDHGYIPLHLVKEKISPFVLAMDINQGPLQKAQENICNHLLEHQIRTRLSDGIRQLQPAEVDCVIIAGMGGRLILKILEQDQEKLSSFQRFILSPHSELEVVREEVLKLGLDIVEEDILFEEGHFYPILICEPTDQIKYLDTELPYDPSMLYQYGRFLIQKRQTCFLSYLELQKEKLQQLMEKVQTAKAKERYEELEQELSKLEGMMEWIRKN